MGRLPKRRWLIGSTAALAASSTLLLSGCGGPATASAPAAPVLPAVLRGDPTQVATAAAQRTVAATPASIALTVPLQQGASVSMLAGKGTIDLARHRLHLVTPNEERQFGRTLYVLLPGEAGTALGGKTWVKVDLDHVTPSSPDPFALAAFDPRQLLSATTAIRDARVAGTDQVDGVATTRFTGTLDPAGLAGSGAQPGVVRQLTAAAGGKPVPLDLWLDDAGLIRRLTLAVAPVQSAAATAAAETGSPAGADEDPSGLTPPPARPEATVELSDFGHADVSFAEPPAAQVADPAALAGLAGSGD